MILLIAHNYIDEPTNNIIDWLLFYNASFIRVNGDDFNFQRKFKIDIEKRTILCESYNIDPLEISCVFYRRWFSPVVYKSKYEYYKTLNYSQEEVDFSDNFRSYLSAEVIAYSNAFFSMFSGKEWIPHHKIARGGLNKIDVLMQAKENGLNIPETLITSRKIDVLEFKNKNGSIITKPISEVVGLEYKDVSITTYTKEVSEKDLAELDECFFPCLFQKKIDKQFEIRIFYYCGLFYSMAIFSQNDSKTDVDFRNYNYTKPNRNIPFKLPKEIESQLECLFKKLKLNTGSIDMMYDSSGNYVFLEINPVGQLTMVSSGIGISLERVIANDLIKKDNDFKKYRKADKGY